MPTAASARAIDAWKEPSINDGPSQKPGKMLLDIFGARLTHEHAMNHLDHSQKCINMWETTSIHKLWQCEKNWSITGVIGSTHSQE